VNAARGAVSILDVHDLKTRKVKANGRVDGNEISARKQDDGRCVKTIVLTFPKRFAIEAAMSVEKAAIIVVVKKIDPSSAGGKENLFWK